MEDVKVPCYLCGLAKDSFEQYAIGGQFYCPTCAGPGWQECRRCQRILPPADIGLLDDGYWYCKGCFPSIFRAARAFRE